MSEQHSIPDTVKNITERRFGKLTVKSYVGKSKMGSAEWLCLCDCGKMVTAFSCGLARGRPTSCGCNDNTEFVAMVQSRVTINDKGCWIYPRKNTKNKYISSKKNGVDFYIHRKMYEICKGPIPEGLNVLHECDTPACCNPAHLFAGTQQENLDDAFQKRRLRHGEKATGAKLTAEKVVEIRRSFSRGITKESLAGQFGMSRRMISNIVNRRAWRHITD